MDPSTRVSSLQQQTLWPCTDTEAQALLVYLILLLMEVTHCLSAS